jgi:CHAT domain
MDFELFLHMSEDGADPDALAASAGELLDDLEQFGSGELTVRNADNGPPLTSPHRPPASRSFMISAFRPDRALLAVTWGARMWLRRAGGRRRAVRIVAGGDSLELTSANPAEQDRLIESFLERQDLPLSRPVQFRGTGRVTTEPSPYEERPVTRGISPARPGEKRETAQAGPDDGRAEINVAADMPSRLQVGRVVSVACHLSRDQIAAVPGWTRDEGRVSADTTRMVTVEILPRANVEVIGEDRTEVAVPGEGQTSDAYFDVRATHPGTCQVWVVVRQGPVPLLTMRLEASATAEPLAGAGPRVPARARLTTAGQTGLDDATWLNVVEMDRGQDTVYRFDLRSSALGIMATFESPPLRHRAEYVASLYREIEDRWLSTASDAEAFQEELREFGGSLLSQLFPEQLQDILWRRRDSLKDLVVLSSEPFIPWELVHLKEPGGPLPDESRFLAETGLVRWLYTRDNAYPPQTLHARPGKVRVIAPDYAEPGLRLVQTAEEAEFLRATLGAELVTAQEREVRALLRSGDFDVLHFAGHGVADGGDIANAKVLLEGRSEYGTYVRTALSATTVGQQARLAHADGSKPLVVFNACQTGRLGAQMSSLGGFAQAFLNRGAGAFISSMWSVGDYPAGAFVETLYRELLRGQPVAAAASAARRRARQGGDGTWLSYAVYAHPQARLLVPGPELR